MKIQDRLYVDKSDREIVESLEQNNYFNFDNKSRKEQFLFALSIGVKNDISMAINKREEWFFAKDLKDEDISLLKACAINKKEDVSVLSNMNNVFQVAESYAHAGFKLLNDMINASSFGSFEKEYEVELRKSFDDIRASFKFDE